MDNDNQDQLVGRCPICGDPESSTDHNDAYVGATVNDSDKDFYLVWSIYYQLYVCRVCRVDGENITIDDIRDADDVIKEKKRQKMGFVDTYTTNSL